MIIPRLFGRGIFRLFQISQLPLYTDYLCIRRTHSLGIQLSFYEDRAADSKLECASVLPIYFCLSADDGNHRIGKSAGFIERKELGRCCDLGNSAAAVLQL